MADPLTLTRRALLTGLCSSALVAPFAVQPAQALGRIPHGGRLKLALPFGLTQIDPHDLNDPLAALFGPCLFDTLFALDPAERSYPALAAGPVEAVPGGLAVQLRPGLLDSRGQRLTSADLEFSLRRAASKGAFALLHPFGRPARDRKNKDLVVFPKGSPGALSAALSSPLTAIVPRNFERAKPEGSGAFRARFSDGNLSLSRNLNAARGAAYLDAIIAEPARDLTDALRRFEAQEVDLGWLGRGLHHVRAGSQLFEGPLLGWLVLHTGKRLGEWGAPGVAQTLLQGLEPAQLERFGLSVPTAGGQAVRYDGPSVDLLTRSDAPHLLELGQTLAQLLAPAGNLRPHAEEPETLRKLLDSGDFDFALELVRSLGPTRTQQHLALLSAADRSLALKPPALPASAQGLNLALHATRATRTGIVGTFRVVAARTPEYAALENWDLPQVYRVKTSR
jgi:peptide/nickel transport system substrate-binding protein